MEASVLQARLSILVKHAGKEKWSELPTNGMDLPSSPLISEHSDIFSQVPFDTSCPVILLSGLRLCIGPQSELQQRVKGILSQESKLDEDFTTWHCIGMSLGLF